MFAHRAMESITLDKKTMHTKDKIMPRYAELIYNGFWFSKERLSIQKIVDQKKSRVQGEVIVKLYKGNISIIGRKSSKSIYSIKKSSFESGKIFSKKYVESFIKNASKKLRK
jgi:argininosuccinate synthase